MNKAMLYEGKDTASLIFSKPKNQGKSQESALRINKIIYADSSERCF